MAGAIIPYSAPKRKRTKKRKSRTEVSSDSESESEVQQRKSKTSKTDEKPGIEDVPASAPTQPAETAAKPRKEKKRKAKTSSTSASISQTTSSENANADTPMTDAIHSSPPSNKPTARASEPSKTKTDSPQSEGDFTSFYLQKVTAELADDLDKVREASDFTARSLPLLVHALKQGESTFSVEEKRRIAASR